MLNEEDKKPEEKKEEQKTNDKLVLKFSDIFTDELKDALDDDPINKKKVQEIIKKISEKSDDEELKKTAEILSNTFSKEKEELYGWKPKAVLKELKSFGSKNSDYKDYCDDLTLAITTDAHDKKFGPPKSMEDLKRRYQDLGKSLTIHALIQVEEGVSDSKEASTSGEDFQLVAAEGDKDGDFMSTLGSLEDRYLVDAGGLAWTMMKKIKPDEIKEVPNPWAAEGDSENAKARDALGKAKVIKKKYTNQFNKAYELLRNSFKTGCEEAKEAIKSGKEIKDPISGKTIGGDTIQKLIGDFTKEKLDALGKTILSQKTDIITLGPKLAVTLLNSIFHKDGNINRLIKIASKGAKQIRDNQKKKSKLGDDFDKALEQINDEKLEKWKTAGEIVLAAYKEFVQKSEEEKQKQGKPEQGQQQSGNNTNGAEKTAQQGGSDAVQQNGAK